MEIINYQYDRSEIQDTLAILIKFVAILSGFYNSLKFNLHPSKNSFGGKGSPNIYFEGSCKITSG